jgi:uncharacterized protein (DUF2236 family)
MVARRRPRGRSQGIVRDAGPVTTGPSLRSGGSAGDPLRAAGGLATAAATAPLRLLGPLAGPVRRDLSRDVRRAIGLPAAPRPPVTDPGTAFLPPGGAARAVHRDLPAMLIGGLTALMLQSLHPLAMAGVAEHSRYEEDPIGRLRRTAQFVGMTTYGTVEEAHEAIEQVKRVHRRVHGIAPDGRPYSADDPDLVTWIHVAETWSFLNAAQRYGPRRFGPDECDAYFAETAVVARALGATWVPESSDETTAYLLRVRPQLYAGPQAIAARNFLLRGVGRRPPDRAIYAVVLGAAIGLLPGWARAELDLPAPPLVDALVVTPMARWTCAVLRWAVYSPAAGGGRPATDTADSGRPATDRADGVTTDGSPTPPPTAGPARARSA